WLIHLVLVVRIDNQIAEVERPPHHHLASISLLPCLTAIIGTKQRAACRLDQSVDHVGFRRRYRNSHTAPRLRRQALGRGLIQLGPCSATIRGFEERAATLDGSVLASRAKCPPFPAEVPHPC